MFLFDNINIHNGRPRYERLKRKAPPTMWNFTVRAVMKADITGIDALSAKNMDLTEQRPIKYLKAEDFFLGKQLLSCSDLNRTIEQSGTS